MKTPTAPQALLALSALLAPIYGGYVASDATKIDPSDFIGSLGQGQAPVLQHALLGLPIVVALVLLLLGRRVQQIPHPYVAGALVLFVGSLAPAVAISAYRGVAVNAWIEWAFYALAFLACVSGLGRRIGPVAVLGAVFAGTAWIARVGVLEYLDIRAADPTWRVFCGWNNPNAAAAMLTLGFFCALGLPKGDERSARLLLNLAVVVGGGLALCALLLTGSKGATLLALPTGLVAFGLVMGRRTPLAYGAAAAILVLTALGFLKSMPYLGIGCALLFAAAALLPSRVHLLRLLAAFAFGFGTLGFFAATARNGSHQTSAGRIAASSDTQDQSATFRLNLWKSALALTRERPVTGWGLGSFRYESAKPGLVTATVFAHNSYLQLAAEAGIGAVALFLGFLGLWARRALRGSSRLPIGQRSLLASSIGGVAAVLAHCLVDSDFSTFGLGLSFFLVLGAATLVAGDAVAPEFVPRPSRTLASAVVVLLGVAFLGLARGDDAKSEVRFAQASGTPGDIASLDGLAGWDGDAAYLRARGLPPEQRVAGLKSAFALLPIPKVARLLAKVQATNGEYEAAESSLTLGLLRDRNNLATLYQLMDVQRRAHADDRAEATARRLVSVEDGPYFTVRSLPQLVPTETYFARLYLAQIERDPRRRAELIATAVRGFRHYAEITVPEIKKAVKTDPQATLAGESITDAAEKTKAGAAAARMAAALFQGLGDAKSAAEMRNDGAFLEKVAADASAPPPVTPTPS